MQINKKIIIIGLVLLIMAGVFIYFSQEKAIAVTSTKQFIIGNSSISPSLSAINYTALSAGGIVSWASVNRLGMVSTAGKLTNFKVQVGVAPGAGTSWTFTVYLNGADSALSVTIADTDTISVLDTSEVTVAAGDRVGLKVAPSGAVADPLALSWTCQFTPDTAGETILISGSAGTGPSANDYMPLIGVKASGAITEFNAQTLFPTAGTLKNLYVQTTAPGAGNSRIYTVIKNSTPSSIVATVSDTNTTANDTTNTLTVAAGDKVTIQVTHSGTPVAGAAYLGMTFVPDTAGEWITAATSDDPLNSAATEYGTVSCGDDTKSATESENYGLAQATTAKKIYVNLSTDPGVAPDAYTFTLRKNGNTTTELTTTITADDTTSNTATDVTISAADLLDTEIIPLDSPSATPASQISYLFYNAPTEEGLPPNIPQIISW